MSTRELGDILPTGDQSDPDLSPEEAAEERAVDPDPARVAYTGTVSTSKG